MQPFRAALPHGAGAMPMTEIDDLSASMEQAVEHVQRAAEEAGLVSLNAARTGAEATALWTTRKALSLALRKIAKKQRGWGRPGIAHGRTDWRTGCACSAP